ncbi:MAG: hypothetical protein HDR17_12960 [Lachnospiraceae bacterium]|nr:hypothetical protein [Lachnospiraceae bacterium]
MNKKKRITTIIVTMAMLCMMAMSALADTNVVVTLPENQVWTSSMPVPRSGAYSYVWVSCDAVYPLYGTDNFSRIQTRLVNSEETLIMEDDFVILKEGDGYQEIYIMEGYLGLETVYIQFRGNIYKGAEAVVNYEGL